MAEAVKTNLPCSVVEVVDPVALNAKLVEKDKCNWCCCDVDITAVPGPICCCFEDDLVSSGDSKTIYVTIGIFTIVKLERNVQLMIPVYDFCIPEKECEGSTDEDPRNVFKNLCFPVEEFFPPM